MDKLLIHMPHVWMMKGILFAWITLWDLCHTLNRYKVIYVHGKRIDTMKECQVTNFHGHSSDIYATSLKDAKMFMFMDNTLKRMSYIGQMPGSSFSWKTSWHLCHAMKLYEVANFHGQASDTYVACLNDARYFICMDKTLKHVAYTGQMQDSLF
jgi:hypothetical protein